MSEVARRQGQILCSPGRGEAGCASRCYRAAVVLSPEGLNDAKNAGEGCCCCCCCCCGNEGLDVKYVNANIMAYALMR